MLGERKLVIVCGGSSHTAKGASFTSAKNKPERVRVLVSSEKIDADILRKTGAVRRQCPEAPVWAIRKMLLSVRS